MEKDSPEYIEYLLNNNPKALNYAVTAIAERDLFSAKDAKNGKYFANWIKEGNVLSGHFIDEARALMLKYVFELSAIAQMKTYFQDAQLEHGERNAIQRESEIPDLIVVTCNNPPGKFSCNG